MEKVFLAIGTEASWVTGSTRITAPAGRGQKNESSQRSRSEKGWGVQLWEACASVEVLCSARESAGAWTPPQSPPRVRPVVPARARERFPGQSLPQS